MFVKGSCTAGNECKFSHAMGLQLPAQAFPTMPTAVAASTGTGVPPLPVASAGDTECNICYEKVLEHNKRFGLLCTRHR